MTTDGPLLPALGVFGFGALEPVVVAALASERPLLLVGAHGTGKSFLLLRLAEAIPTSGGPSGDRWQIEH